MAAPYPRTPEAPAQATRTTHHKLSTLQAALHGGLPPALMRCYSAYSDSDSDEEALARRKRVAQPHVGSRQLPVHVAERSMQHNHTRSRSARIDLADPRPHSPPSASSSEESRVHDPLPTVVDARRELVLRERTAPPVRRFRVRERYSNSRLCNVSPRTPDEITCVHCRSGAPLWSVYPARHVRARQLRKHGSPYFVVLGAHVWNKHAERVAFAYLHAAPELNRAPALALEIRGDALAKNFRVLGRDENRTLDLASAARCTRLVQDEFGTRELATWSVNIERNVDCAMIAALVFVLDEWCAVGPDSARR